VQRTPSRFASAETLTNTFATKDKMKTTCLIIQVLLLLGASLGLAGERQVHVPHETVDVTTINSTNSSKHLAYLQVHAKPPIDYVVDKFEAHDAVLLGEMHEIKENCDFISELVEPLYNRAGVRILATEFIRRRNTDKINQLVTSKKYDEGAVISIFRDFGQPWGFKEYMDIVKAVWRFNRQLPPDAERFRIVGLDSNWSQYDVLFKMKDDISRSREYESREKHMIRTFEEEVLLKKDKALVHLGYAHTFPDERFGGVLHKKYGDRIFWACLHHQHSDRLIAFLEELFAKNENKAIGFDVSDSPFENLRDNTSPYFKFMKDSTFSQLSHGYVFLKPVARLKRITWVEGFVDDSNFERIRGIALKRKWIAEDVCTTASDLDKHMKKLFESH
jgi:hypothetical protein